MQKTRIGLVVSDGSASTTEDSAGVGIDLGTFVTDVETTDGNLTYTIDAGPSNGILSGTGQNRTYTPTRSRTT